MSMILSDADLKFVKKRTKLSIDKVKLLTEEDSDYNLLMESISKSKVTKKERQSLSFESLARFYFYQTIGVNSFKNETLTIIIDALVKHYKDIQKSDKIRSLFKDYEKNEKYASYFLVLVGTQPTRIIEESPDSPESVVFFLKKYFRNKNLPEISDNIIFWVEILGEVGAKLEKNLPKKLEKIKV